MCRKTVIKRLTKYLPKTDQWDKLATAIDLTNQDWNASMGQISLIESLLMNASISEIDKCNIEADLHNMSHDAAARTIKYLKENQADRITSGHPYSHTDAQGKLDETMQDERK